MNRLALLASILGLALPAQAASQGDAKADLERLQGTWTVVGGEANGRPFPAEVVERDAATYTFEGDQVTVRDRGKTRGVLRVTLDATKRPKALDMKDLEGQENFRTIHAIYEVRGETLRICMDTKTGRPDEFSGKDSAVLFEFKRTAPAKP